jgi:glucuronokinase
VSYAVGVARVEVPARSALVGNPSDQFGGATIAFTLDELTAVVQAEPALGVEITAGDERIEFADIGALTTAGARGEYPPEGPAALLMAAAKRFAEHREDLAERGVRLAVVRSSIPPGVGLAGSSAIVIGALRALGRLFADEIPEAALPELALACEAEELDIPAGPQDRVVQTYGGLLFMDFNPSLPGWGRHEPLDAGLLPQLFVAWLAGEPSDSGEVHRAARARFAAGDRAVADAMGAAAALARRALTPLALGDAAGLGVLLDENFELRRRIYDLDPRHVALIDAARELGAPANYTGSGGAIVGLFRDEDHLAALREALEGLGCELLVRRPVGRVQ